MAAIGTPEQLAKRMNAEAAWRRDQERREATQEVLNAYYGGPDWRQDFGRVLRKIFKDPDKADRPELKLGVVKKFGNLTSTVFEKQPDFKVLAGDDEDEDQTTLFKEIVKRGRWMQRLKTANVHENIVSTIHLWPRRVGGVLELRVISPAATIVFQSDEDPQRADGIAYRRSQSVDSVHVQQVTPELWVFWSRDKHFTFEMDRHGNIGKKRVRDNERNPGHVNPYRFAGDKEAAIPVKVDVVDPPDDEYWCQPAYDALLMENGVNAQIMAMAEAIINQGFTITHSTNIPQSLFAKGRSPGSHYAVENQREGDVPASIGALQLTADIEGMVAGIEFQLQQWAVLNGLPPAAFSIKNVAESGLSKRLDRVEIESEDVSDQDRWKAVLSDLFEAAKRVWNVEQSRNSGMAIPGTFSEDAELLVDFPEEDTFETDADRRERWEWELKNGFASPVDIMIEKNPDLDRDQAVKELERIARERQEFSSRGVLGMFGLGDEAAGAEDEGVPAGVDEQGERA
jgi:hypothetical protein